jgi:NTE family protein
MGVFIILKTGADCVKVNAVFEGGGVKAIALVGALKAAEERGMTFQGLAGTSSGAIISSLLAAGYTADEMKEMILEAPFKSFLKKTWLHRINIIGTSIRIVVKKGLYSGDTLENWVRQKLLAKGIRYFGDLSPNKLRIIASDITRGRLLVLPNDIAQYGMEPEDLEIAKAVRMSTSIPYFFDPVILAKLKIYKQSIYIVDGALLSNFPLWIFDKAYTASDSKKVIPTIGFQLVGKNENIPKNIYGPLSMFQALFSTMMDAHDERYIEKQNRFRTIKIPTLGVKTTEFDISKEVSLKLFESGMAAANDFFDGWSFSNYLIHLNEYVN